MAQDMVLFTMRIPQWVKRGLENVADRDHRSTASLVTMIVQRWLDGEPPYKPDFDHTALARRQDDILRSDLRPIPGRPRWKRNPAINTKGVQPVLGPLVCDKDRVALDDIFNLTSLEQSPGMIAMIREFFIEIDWREYQDENGKKVFAKLRYSG